MSQLVLAANAAVSTRDQSPRKRSERLARVAEIIARTQRRNHKAQQSHHRRTIARLARCGIDLTLCRCCLPENKTCYPAL